MATKLPMLTLSAEVFVDDETAAGRYTFPHDLYSINEAEEIALLMELMADGRDFVLFDHDTDELVLFSYNLADRRRQTNFSRH